MVAVTLVVAVVVSDKTNKTAMSENFIEGIKPFLVGILILVGVSVGLLVFVGSAPDSIIVINPLSDIIPEVAALSTGALCCPGVICIFVKKIRMYVLIVLAFVLLLFLSATCINAALERISYLQTKQDEPVKRTAVILPQQEGHALSFKFLDNGEEAHVDTEGTLTFYPRMEAGDTCVAYFVEGIMGIDFVTDMYVRRRGRH